MKTVGIIFSNIHDQALPELTKLRTIASVPVAARYRMVDFTLSGMANAGIAQVGIITKTKYQSLMRHVRNGKPWDLDRKNGGVTIISPYVEAGSGPLYTNRLEALQNSLTYITDMKADNVVLADCDLIANIPYGDIIRAHEESGADITAAYKRVNFHKKRLNYNMEFTIGDDRKIERVANHSELMGTMNFGMNIYVIKKHILIDMIRDSLIYGYKSFSREIFPYYLGKVDVRAYEFKGYLYGISSLNDYFESSMDMLNERVRAELFQNEDAPILTTVRDSAPTVYGDASEVSNSIISDGCVIEGKVENSIIFRGVRIDEGAVVRNSIVMQNAIIESGANLNYIITDKKCVVRKGKTIAGCEGYPFFINYGAIL